jgi:hypothetical protein
MRLPEADAETRAWFIACFWGFSSHVRAVDYASGRPLFHSEILAFGTHQDQDRDLMSVQPGGTREGSKARVLPWTRQA